MCRRCQGKAGFTSEVATYHLRDAIFAVQEQDKALSTVEHILRSCKTIDIEVRPVYRWNQSRVRVFLWLLAYHLEWHVRRSTESATLRPG